jgi:spore coat polysaccharide biosynthesis predicted glycosyltransferase SpsG/CMP-N-acetylneuraminic acid synthetase
MRGNLRVLAVVPARGGYDEVPYLNIKKLGPLPLVAHTLEEARKSQYIDRVVVSTDDERVASVAREYGAEVPFMRPAELANVPLIKAVVAHAVRFLEENEGDRFDLVVMLQATSPFRSAAQIDEALDQLVEGNLDSVVSVREEKALMWRLVDGKLTPAFGTPGRREDMEPLFREDGAIWVMSRAVLDQTERLGSHVGYTLMDKSSSLTVHDIHDFWLAEKLVRLPRIIFRVDGGAEIGMGHVYRSLAIADELRSISNSDVQFLMSAEHPEGVKRVSSSGYTVRVVSGKRQSVEAVVEAIQEYSPNIVVNDRPFLEKDYLEALAKLGASTVNLVDSLEDIEKPGEMTSMIIATMHADQLELDEYYGGPEFAILRESFAGRSPAILEEAREIVVSFGGSDPQGLTLKVLRALDSLDQLGPDLSVKAVLGPAFSYKQELQDLMPKLRRAPTLLENVEHMAEILSGADLVLCAGGMTVYEIAALGTPGIVLCQNAKEKRRMETFSKFESIVHLGLGTEVGEELIRESARALLSDVDRRRAMSAAGRKLVDAKGAQRAAEVVKNAVQRGPATGRARR